MKGESLDECAVNIVLGETSLQATPPALSVGNGLMVT